MVMDKPISTDLHMDFMTMDIPIMLIFIMVITIDATILTETELVLLTI